MIDLRPPQTDCTTAFYQYYTTKTGNTLAAMCTGCHAAGTKILLFSGELKNVEDITDNDVLMGDDGNPRNINMCIFGYGKLYKIIPNKGESFIVNEDHILSLQTTCEGFVRSKRKTGKEIVNLSVKEYVNKNYHFKHVHKLYKRAVNFSEKELLISPYMAGALLGDGSTLRGLSFTTMDEILALEFIKETNKFNCSVRKETKKDNKASSYYAYYKKSHKNEFVENLKKEELWGKICSDKYIPNKYKTSSRNQRLEILAGLIDTDGSLSQNGYDYISKSKRLAEDVVFICRSLGLSAQVKECQKGCQNNFIGTYYRVSISGHCSIVPVKLKRKVCPDRKINKDNLKVGFKVEEYGYGMFYGFSIDKNNLYLAGDFFVHHNSGKSVVAAKLSIDVVSLPNRRVLQLSHKAEILSQNWERVIQMDPKADVGIYSSGLGMKQLGHAITIAGIQSVYDKGWQLGFFHLVIIDEVHLLSDKDDGMYRKLIKTLREINPNVRIIGLSATLWRTKGGLLTNGENPIFDEIVYEYTIKDALNDGYLCPLVGKSSAVQADLSKVKTAGGEFVLKDMAGAIDKEELTQAALDEVMRLASNRKSWLFFCAGVDHAQHVCDALIQRGIEARCITEKTSKAERKWILEAFSKGEIQAVTNNDVLTTGTDIPRIDLVVLLRGTKSPGLLIQMTGRGMRLHPGKKDCLLLDFAGNLERFGPIDLITAPKKHESQPGVTPSKICPECRSPAPISSRNCPECDYEFPIDDMYKHATKASNASVLSQESAWHDIGEVYYTLHLGKKELITDEQGFVVETRKPDSLRVNYVTVKDNPSDIAREFREWVCLQHSGFAKAKATKWIEKRIVIDPDIYMDEYYNLISSVSIKDIIDYPDLLVKPIKIEVRRNGKYEEIVNYEF